MDEDPPASPQEPTSEPIGPEVPARARRVGPRVVVVLAVIVALAAAGTVYALRSGSGSNLDERVPATVAAFVDISIEPGGGQRAALRSLLGRLEAKERTALMSAIDDLLEGAFEPLGLSYMADVKPWVGGEIAVAVTALDASVLAGGAPPVVGLLEVRDEARARVAIQRIVDADDSPLRAFEIDGGVAYLGLTQAAIDDFQASATKASLATDTAYGAQRSALGEGLAFAWLNSTGLNIPGMSLPGVPASGQKGTAAVVLRVTEQAIELVGTSSAGTAGVGGGTPKLLESTSAGLLGSVTMFDIGRSVATALDSIRESGLGPAIAGGFSLEDTLGAFGIDLTKDVLPWLHGEASVVLGAITPAGPQVGLLIEPTDRDALRRTLTKVKRALRDLGGVDAQGGDDFDVAAPGGVTVAVRAGSDRLVVASPPSYASALLATAPDALAADEVYRRAVGDTGDGTVMQMFVRLDRIRSLLEAFLPPTDRAEYDRTAGPFLSLFESFSVRVATGQGGGSFRVALVVAQ
jgi:hypothetical protein